MTKRLEDANCLSATEALLIDPRATYDMLHTGANQRLEAAKSLLPMLSGLRMEALDAQDLINVSAAVHILLEDASDLFTASRRMVNCQGGRHG